MSKWLKRKVRRDVVVYMSEGEPIKGALLSSDKTGLVLALCQLPSGALIPGEVYVPREKVSMVQFP